MGKVLAGAVFAAALLAGCSSAPDWVPGGRQLATVEAANVEEAEVSIYLRTMYELASAPPEEQRELFATIERRADRSPTTTNRFGLALAQITSGHPGTDTDQGRETLRSLLAEDGLLVETERQLAIILLNEIDLRQRITDANDAERQSTLASSATERERLQQELAAARAEQERLADELRQAEEKLSAITSIERSIRERADDGTTQ